MMYYLMEKTSTIVNGGFQLVEAQDIALDEIWIVVIESSGTSSYMNRAFVLHRCMHADRACSYELASHGRSQFSRIWCSYVVQPATANVGKSSLVFSCNHQLRPGKRSEIQSGWLTGRWSLSAADSE